MISKLVHMPLSQTCDSGTAQPKTSRIGACGPAPQQRGQCRQNPIFLDLVSPGAETSQQGKENNPERCVNLHEDRNSVVQLMSLH